MICLDTPLPVEKFRALILARLGLLFDEGKLPFLAEVLQRRLEGTRRSCDEYLALLADEASPLDLGPLAKELTVTETYFFRNSEQFRVFTDVVLPSRMSARAGGTALNFLSAGCASGEEPYSIAMSVMSTVPRTWSVSIRAADINPLALERARKARYSPWAFRETSPELLQAWFHGDGRDKILDGAIRGAVRFEQKNLIAEDPDLWPADYYDAIFCRNVMMYFSPEQQRALVARIARSLAPGGFLFLGHAETLRGLSDDFHLLHSHGAFYYTRKDAPLAPSPGPAHVSDRRVAGAPVADDSWLQAIRDASERVETLTARHAGAVPSGSSASGHELTHILSLLHREHFSEALISLRKLPHDTGRDPDTLLLEAMLLVHNGDVSSAEEACRRLLAIDEMNAGAHYILALCHEARGDQSGAMEQNRLAVYLDPTFAMPRLHIGLLARRNGDRDLARRELGQAHSLLQHEDAARLMLFGGGFNRQAMLDLCSSVLRDCGVSS